MNVDTANRIHPTVLDINACAGDPIQMTRADVICFMSRDSLFRDLYSTS